MGGSRIAARGFMQRCGLTGRVDAAWQDAYFAWLRENCDARTGIGRKREADCVELPRHLYGWFHYLFCHADAHRPFPYPKSSSTAVWTYTKTTGSRWGRGLEMCSFREVDWVFSLNRALRQCPHRFDEGKAALRDFAKGFTAYLLRADEETDESLDDCTHSLGRRAHWRSCSRRFPVK